MNNEIANMYDVEDDEVTPTKENNNQLTVSSLLKGITTELTINGSVIEIVNPDYVRELQRLILELTNRVKTLDRNIRVMDLNHKKQQRLLLSVQGKLDGKIDRE